MVNVDCPVMGTERGEPVEKLWLTFALPLASVPEGPVTTQEFTPTALHDICELSPE